MTDAIAGGAADGSRGAFSKPRSAWTTRRSATLVGGSARVRRAPWMGEAMASPLRAGLSVVCGVIPPFSW